MRYRAIAMLALAWAGAAGAAPTVSLTWVETTGTSQTGSSHTFPTPGDVLTLLITVTGDANGLSFVGLSLDWDGGDLVASNAQECPGPENAFSAFGCTANGDPAPPFFSNTPDPGVVVDNVGGFAGQFTASNDPGLSGVFDLYVGRIQFTVGGSATIETVTVAYGPGDGIEDALGNVYFPSATADFTPEPGTAGLLGMGLLGLGLARRGGSRRSKD